MEIGEDCLSEALDGTAYKADMTCMRAMIVLQPLITSFCAKLFGSTLRENFGEAAKLGSALAVFLRQRSTGGGSEA